MDLFVEVRGVKMVKNYNQITKLHFQLKIGGFLLGLACGICASS